MSRHCMDLLGLKIWFIDLVVMLRLRWGGVSVWGGFVKSEDGGEKSGPRCDSCHSRCYESIKFIT